MALAYSFTDPRLAKLNGFRVELDVEKERNRKEENNIVNNHHINMA